MQRSAVGPAYLLLLLALLVAACGGAASSPGGGGGGGATASADVPTATDGSAASDEPASTDEPEASEPADGGGGGTISGAAVCSLAVGTELGEVFGVPVNTIYDPNAPSSCFVRTADDTTLIHWTTAGDGPMLFDALSAGSTPVDGLGDRAAHVENLGLMIVKGDTLVTIVVPAEADLDADVARDAAERVGALIAGRM